MHTNALPRRLEETPKSASARYLRAIGKLLARFYKYNGRKIEQVSWYESEAERLRAEVEGSKPRIAGLARGFRDFAARYRDKLLTGKTKTVRTEAGSFGFANDPEGVAYKGTEEKVIAELLVRKQYHLLRMESKKRGIAAAINSGVLKGMKMLEVRCRERFVITPTGQIPVTVCENDLVRIEKEELEG